MVLSSIWKLGCVIELVDLSLREKGILGKKTRVYLFQNWRHLFSILIRRYLFWSVKIAFGGESKTQNDTELKLKDFREMLRYSTNGKCLL